jgi:hypothetical protein
MDDIDPLDPADIVREAHHEYLMEERRAAIERVKARLRAARWWHRLFPYIITIERRP